MSDRVSSRELYGSGENGVAFVCCVGGPGMSINFVGASCPASVVPGTDGSSKIQFSPVRGREDVAALVVVHNDGRRGCLKTAGFVRFRWAREKVEVDLGIFVSKMGLVQVMPNGDLLVTTHGQKFGTCHSRYDGRGECFKTKKEFFLKAGCRIVDDPDLLCRYLIGHATFGELEAVASKDLHTAEQIQIAGLEERVDRISREWFKTRELLESETRRNEELLVTIGEADAKITQLRYDLNSARKVRNELNQLYENACGEITNLNNKLNRTLGDRIRDAFAKGEKFWLSTRIPIRR